MSNFERDKTKVPFDLNEIFQGERKILKDIVNRRRMTLTDKAVRMLPFFPKEYVKHGANNSVDIADDNFSTEKDGGRLILRIGVNSKIWYAATANRKGSRAKMIKIAKYAYNKNAYYSDKKTKTEDFREANVETARERFRKTIADHYSEYAVARKQGTMTIREYLESGQYKLDRESYKIERGVIKHVEPSVIKTLLSQFKPWLDKELHEVSSDWPLAFKEHWDNRYVKFNEDARKADQSHVDKVCEPSTQRKYFSEIQSMFSIAEKAGYIERNWLKGHTGLFPKKKKKRGTTVSYKFEYEDLFDFIYNEAESGTDNGKLFICVMAVTGCRNSEIYKNHKRNLELIQPRSEQEYFNLEIPAWLCKTRDSGEGTIQIRHPFVVNKLKEHLKRNDVKNSAYIFPSPVKANSHCSDDAYRDLWKEIKRVFGLGKKAKLYSLRATLGTRLSKKVGLPVAANLLRDNLQTAMLYYDDVSGDRIAEGLDAVFANNEIVNQPSAPSVEQPVQTVQEPESNLIDINNLTIPESLSKNWDMFKGKRLRDGSMIAATDYDEFVDKVRKNFDAGKINDMEVEDWLDFQ